MTTEPKKLQTEIHPTLQTLTRKGGGTGPQAAYAISHDARLAHEMLAALKAVSQQLQNALHSQPCLCEVCKADLASLALAMPFLED